MIRLAPRELPQLSWTLCVYGLAVVAALSLTSLMLALSGLSVARSFGALVGGAVGSDSAIVGTLAKATPLILTGLATVIAYRARVWSVGQEGQVFAGAMAGYAASLALAGLPTVAVLACIIAAGAIGGAVLGGLAAVLRNRFGVNEIISTVMLNYLVVLFLSWLIGGGPWTEVSETVVYQQSPPLPDAAWLPVVLPGDKVHLGLILGLGAAVACHELIARTPLGYDIRALGLNPVALSARGTDAGRTVLIVLCVSGALAGLAGMGEIHGTAHRLRADNLVGLGYAGIIIGMIGGLRPWGAVVAGLVFGGFAQGALYMKVVAGVPAGLVPTMEGILLVAFLCAGVFARFRVVRDG